MDGLDLFSHETQPVNLSKKFLFSIEELVRKKKEIKAHSVCLLLVNNRTRDNIWVQHKEISPTFSVLLDTAWLWMFVH